jgi:hypothetical protein
MGALRRGPSTLLRHAIWSAVLLAAGLPFSSGVLADDAALARIDARYAEADSELASDIPDFRRHVVPLMGRLGCNGRACHGSFQGQGGFQLSLFGYDFKADHENLVGGDEPRINVASPRESLALRKPLEEEPHDGGQRLQHDTWQLRVLEQWIHGGAEGADDAAAEFVRLDVEPRELVASQVGQQWNLRAVAVWSDGSREDVTPLCRFQSNNDQIATIDEHGLVTAAGPGDTHVVAFYDNGVVPVPILFPVSDQVGPNYPDVPTPTPIDELVVAKLRKLGEVPSGLCTDGEFLRRVSLDLTGTLPTEEEAEAFLADTDPEKRARKIDELLERPGYAAWWATRFCDWTGNNAQENQQNGPDRRNVASVLWYEWMRARVAENTPYDEIVERIVLSKSRLDGESYEDYCERMSGYLVRGHESEFGEQQHSMPYYWSRRNFRTTEERALGFAYAFLGVRIQCAQCHKHPFDQWTKDDFDRFENFFTRVRYQQFRQLADSDAASEMMEALDISRSLRGNQLDQQLTRLAARGEVVPFGETVVMPPPKPMSEEAMAKMRERANSPEQKARLQQFLSGRTATVLGGQEAALDELDDPREVLMAWMRSAENPYFARAIVNRVWASYFNVGIVEPPDDLSLANPPSNEPLLDHLAREFRERGYDLKWLHREICMSRTYQLSWQPNATNASDDRNFARAVARRIPAEVIYDAIKIATAGAEESQALCSLEADRAIDDAVVDSRGGSYALNVFGRSLRESNCDCDRSMEPSLLQTVFLQNDSEMLAMISRQNGWVAEVTKTLGEPASEGALADPAMQRVLGDRPFASLSADEVAEMIEKGKARLARAKRDNDDEALARGRQILAAMQRRLEHLRATEAVAAEAAAAADEAVAEADVLDADAIDALVRSAYLRTLTRMPEQEEIERARAYFADVPSNEAARDLLWALLNTKEFQLNH